MYESRLFFTESEFNNHAGSQIWKYQQNSAKLSFCKISCHEAKNWATWNFFHTIFWKLSFSESETTCQNVVLDKNENPNKCQNPAYRLEIQPKRINSYRPLFSQICSVGWKSTIVRRLCFGRPSLPAISLSFFDLTAKNTCRRCI